MNTLQVVALSLALAFIAESFVEYLFGQAVDHAPALAPYRWLLLYVALAAGVGMCWWYQADLLSIILEQQPTTLGVVLTGLIVGRGANFVHQFVSQYLPQK